MNKIQKSILVAARENNNELPAPRYNLILDEAQSYCGLHNIKFIVLARDYSLTLTKEGKDKADELILEKKKQPRKVRPANTPIGGM